MVKQIIFYAFEAQSLKSDLKQEYMLQRYAVWLILFAKVTAVILFHYFVK